MEPPQRRDSQAVSAALLLVAAAVGIALLAAGGAVAADGIDQTQLDETAAESDAVSAAGAYWQSTDDDPYFEDDDGEGTIFREEEVVTRGESGADTVISGEIAERGEQTAIVETEDGVRVVVNDDEEVVTEDGERVMTVSGTVINRFDVDDGSDLRTADEPFEELVIGENDRLETESGEPVIDDRGVELIANRDALPYEQEFSLAIAGATDVDEGEQIDVTVDITNEGLADGERNVALFFEGERKDSETVRVEAETTQSVELSYTTQDGDWGFDRELAVHSEELTDSTEVNISRGGLRVSDSDWNAPVDAGETFETSITIERAGDLGPDRAVSYELVFEVEDEVDVRRIVSLASGESTTETFEYDTDAGDPPTLPHRVTVGDRVFPAEPDVREPTFTVEADHVTESAVAGDVVRVNGTVRNDGFATDEQEIELQLNDSAADGGWQTVSSQAVELEPLNETSIEFFYRTSAGTPETLDLRMASNETMDGGTTQVQETDDELRLTDLTPDPDPAAGGAVVTFDAVVENRGNETRTARVSLERGLDILHERDIEVPAGDSTTATLPTQAPVEEGTYQYSAVIRGDAATTELEVDGVADDAENVTDASTEPDDETEPADDDPEATDDQEETDDPEEETPDEEPETADDPEETDDPEEEPADEDPDEAEDGGLPWLSIGGAVLAVLLVVGLAVAATRAEELPVDIPDAPAQVVQTARASAVTAAGTVAQQLPVDIGIGSTGQVTVANVTPDQARFKIRCRTPEEITLFEDRTIDASSAVDLDGLPDAGPVKIEINVKGGPRDDIEVTHSDSLSAAQIVIQAYDIDFTVE